MDNRKGPTPGRDQDVPGRQTSGQPTGRRHSLVGEEPSSNAMSPTVGGRPLTSFRPLQPQSSPGATSSIIGALLRSLTPEADPVYTPQSVISSFPQSLPALDSQPPSSVPMQRGSARFQSRTRQAPFSEGMTATAGPTTLPGYNDGNYSSGPGDTNPTVSLDPSPYRSMPSKTGNHPAYLPTSNEVRPPIDLSHPSRPNGRGVAPELTVSIREASTQHILSQEINEATHFRNSFSEPDSKTLVPGGGKATFKADQVGSHDKPVGIQRFRNPFSPSKHGSPSPFPVTNSRNQRPWSGLVPKALHKHESRKTSQKGWKKAPGWKRSRKMTSKLRTSKHDTPVPLSPASLI